MLSGDEELVQVRYFPTTFAEEARFSLNPKILSTARPDVNRSAAIKVPTVDIVLNLLLRFKY